LNRVTVNHPRRVAFARRTQTLVSGLQGVGAGTGLVMTGKSQGPKPGGFGCGDCLGFLSGGGEMGCWGLDNT
jgi:hypothetical protein